MAADNTTDFPHTLNFSNSSSCLKLSPSILVLSAYIASHIFLLPVFVSVLCLGVQRRRRRCSTTDPTSPSDLFTYHYIIMQLNDSIGFILMSLGCHCRHTGLMTVGSSVLSIAFIGKALFHFLTCMERYLAVVHPITYLQVKQASGVRITNISIRCVWLVSFSVLITVNFGSFKFRFAVFSSFMTSLLAVVTLCSISVLRALKRPGPGDAGRKRRGVDKSKQKAFYTILAILGLLVLRFGGGLVVNILLNISLWTNSCTRFLIVVWFDIPSTLVLPLLYLHRAGKLHCCGL